MLKLHRFRQLSKQRYTATEQYLDDSIITNGIQYLMGGDSNLHAISEISFPAILHLGWA